MWWAVSFFSIVTIWLPSMASSIHVRQQCVFWMQYMQPHPEHEYPSTNLVPVGELGSLVQKELQGWKASSSAGPVDRCGFQLNHTFTQLTDYFVTVVLFIPWLFLSLTLSFLSIEAPASSNLFIISTWPLNEALCRAVLWNWTNVNNLPDVCQRRIFYNSLLTSIFIFFNT